LKRHVSGFSPQSAHFVVFDTSQFRALENVSEIKLKQIMTRGGLPPSYIAPIEELVAVATGIFVKPVMLAPVSKWTTACN
jgi:hypothetical protein